MMNRNVEQNIGLRPLFSFWMLETISGQNVQKGAIEVANDAEWRMAA